VTRRVVAGAALAALVAAGALAATRGDGKRPPARAARIDRWVALRSAPLQRSEVGAARVGGAIYVVGGFVPPGRTTAAVERYDVRRNRWTQARSMPIALNHAAAAAYGGRLYVVGGYAAAAGLSDEVSMLVRYDPRSDRWTRLPSAPTRRAALAVGVLGDRLYVAGGARAGVALRTLEVFDLRRGRWSRGPDMAVAREHLAGAVAGGAFYVLGGRAAGRGNFTVAERFVPAHRRWERLPALQKARGGIAAAAVGGDVVVFGGEEAPGTIRPVERYDSARRRWTPLPGMRTPRHGLGGAALRRRVYALEGGVRPGLSYSSALEALDVR
jgi:N-acetylneuraminic acid mutarotase